MEAVRFTSRTKALQLVQIPVPKVNKSNDVLIKVAYSGICGTDLHIIQGEFPCDETDTVTLGHEFSGTVVEVGSDVQILKKGDKVAVNPNDSCNCCHFCQSGQPHFCSVGGVRNAVGIFRNGGWATYATVPVEQVHKLKKTISLEQGVLSEPLSCIAHGWDIISPVTIGQKILVIGAGIIGNLWVSNLHLQGHKNVTVSEPNKTRLEMLKKLETGYTLLTPDQLKKNHDSDPEYLFDVIVDCSGFAPAIEQAIGLLQKGGKLCCFGVAPPHAKISIKPFDIYMKELKIFGVIINCFSFPKSLGLLESMGDRYLDFEKLGIMTFALKEYNTAIEYLKKGIISKAVFKIE